VVYTLSCSCPCGNSVYFSFLLLPGVVTVCNNLLFPVSLLDMDLTTVHTVRCSHTPGPWPPGSS